MKTIQSFEKDNEEARQEAATLMDKLLQSGKKFVFVRISIKGVEVKQRTKKEHEKFVSMFFHSGR